MLKAKKSIFLAVSLCLCMSLVGCGNHASISGDYSSSAASVADNSSSNTANSSAPVSSNSTEASSSSGTQSSSSGTQSSSSTATSSSASESSVAPDVYYEVKFVNADGTSLYTTRVKEGEKATYTGDTPTKATDDTFSYQFNGWDKDPLTTSITAATTFTATYKSFRLGTEGLIYNYNEDGESFSVIGYTGSKNIISIPEEYKGLPVTSIGDEAFYNLDITSLYVSSSIKTISYGAFENCEELTSVTLQEGLDFISYGAFSECKKLASINLPDSVTSIQESAFDGCDSLTEVSIGNNVAEIYNDSFPSSFVSTLLSDGTEYLTSRDSTHFYLLGVDSTYTDENLAVKSGTNVIALAKSATIKTVTIPEGVKHIADSAFEDDVLLESVTFPSTLEYLGDDAFYGCVKLSSIDLPSSLTYLGDGAFSGCTVLDTVTCDDYSNLEELYVDHNPVFFKSTKFATDNTGSDGCLYLTDRKGQKVLVNYDENLTSVTFDPDTITLCGSAFNCSDLTTINIPAKLKNLGYSSLTDSQKVTSITVDSENPYFKTDADNKVLFNKEGTKIILSVLSLESYEVPAEVTEIGSSSFSNGSIKNLTFAANSKLEKIGNAAFEWCDGIESVSLPSGLKYLESGAFSDATSLTNCDLPDTLIFIGNDCFADIKGLTSISIPASVCRMDSQAFYDCNSVTTVTFAENLKMTYLATQVFYGNTKLESVNIPASISEINENAFSGCTGLTQITISDDNKVFTCDNHLLINENKNILLKGLVADSYTIPSNVTYIGNGAFYKNQMTTVSFGEESKLEKIGPYAFQYCPNLSSFILPDSVKTISDDCFEGSQAMTSFTISKDSKLESIGRWAFCNCTFTSIFLPKTLIEVDFSGLSNKSENILSIYLDADIDTSNWNSSWRNESYSTVYSYGTLSGQWQWVSGAPTVNAKLIY